MNDRILGKLYAAALAAATALVAAKLLAAAWEAVTGEGPPEPDDPNVPVRVALTWAVASGVGIAVAQAIGRRFATSHLDRIAARQRRQD